MDGYVYNNEEANNHIDFSLLFVEQNTTINYWN